MFNTLLTLISSPPHIKPNCSGLFVLNPENLFAIGISSYIANFKINYKNLGIFFNMCYNIDKSEIYKANLKIVMAAHNTKFSPETSSGGSQVADKAESNSVSVMDIFNSLGAIPPCAVSFFKSPSEVNSQCDDLSQNLPSKDIPVSLIKQ